MSHALVSLTPSAYLWGESFKSSWSTMSIWLPCASRTSSNWRFASTINMILIVFWAFTVHWLGHFLLRFWLRAAALVVLVTLISMDWGHNKDCKDRLKKQWSPELKTSVNNQYYIYMTRLLSRWRWQTNKTNKQNKQWSPDDWRTQLCWSPWPVFPRPRESWSPL